MAMWLMVLLSTVMGVISKSWLMIWAMMEISSIGFVVLMGKNNYEMKDGMLKYYFVQSVASLSMLMGIFNSSLKSMENSSTMSNTSEMIIVVAMITKMGIAPLHMWMMKVGMVMKMKWMIVMLTWQKIMPLWVAMKKMSMPLIVAGVLSMVIGTLSQMNNINLKLVMVMSSINHSGWLMMSLLSYMMMPMMYLLGYSLLLMDVAKMVTKSSMKKISKQSKKNWKMLVSMMSLAGMPPMIGFIMKWMVFKQMVSMNLMTMAITMVILATINMYIYMRLMLMVVTVNKMHVADQEVVENKMPVVNIMAPAMSMQMLK